MATKKAAGSAKNLTTSNPQYLGIKLYAGESAKPGAIIVRQRGTRILPGKNVGMGRDHTLYSLVEGTVLYGHKRKVGFDNTTSVKKTASVLPRR
ncbi:MAG: 50S ribosomal protein L27, chloroplastic-like [Parcubacteria group bacterium Gr01-1014_72]|nr:MAG: 50S ribosomal protein L27, chloroplastic-like [Parcubacteria group bacterium Gr01-1014_72]